MAFFSSDVSCHETRAALGAVPTTFVKRRNQRKEAGIVQHRWRRLEARPLTQVGDGEAGVQHGGVSLLSIKYDATTHGTAVR